MGKGLSRDERRAAARIRVQAVKQLQRGGSVAEVADVLGFKASTVYRWAKMYADGGLEALEGRKAVGKPPKLTLTQVTKLRALIVEVDPRQLRFEFALWTREMVGELIGREFGVVMSPSAVGRLLRRVGLSPQRLLWRAYQANPDAVERWKAEEFPAIRAEAARVGGVVFFQDEASVRSDYHGGTTWGEVGHTPVVATTGARYRERLLADNPDRPVFLVCDGHPSHRAKRTKEWVQSMGGRLKLFFLPAYSPQLNPDEWVWKNVKHDRVGKAGITSHDDLRHKAVAALQRLADTPNLVRAFFGDPDLAYITK